MLRLWEIQPDPDKENMEELCEKSSLKMEDRFTKTLYYGEMPDEDCPSLPLTDIAVDYLRDVTPRKLGRVDSIFASSLASRAYASPCSVMMSMIYAKRLRSRNPDYMDQISSSELFLISMMMASKFMYDEGVEEEVFNDEWAEAADMELADINQLERDFLQAIDWQLFVKRSEFFQLVNRIEQRIALQQGTDRGWFSYTDLLVLSRNKQYSSLWLEIAFDWFQVILVSSTAYIAAMMTVVASTILALHVSVALTSISSTMLTKQPDGPLQAPLFNSVSFVDHSSLDTAKTHYDHTFLEMNDSTLPIPATNQTDEQTVIQNVKIETLMMNKLFALIALKENIVKFLCAVADNWTQSEIAQRRSRHRQNKSHLPDNIPLFTGKCCNCGIQVPTDSGHSSRNQASVPYNRYTCPSCLLADRSRPIKFCENQKCLQKSQSRKLSHPVGPSNRLHDDCPCFSVDDQKELPCLEEPPGSVDVSLFITDKSLSFTTRAHLPILVHA